MVTEKLLFVVWTIVGFHKFNSFPTTCLSLSKPRNSLYHGFWKWWPPLAHKITLWPGQYVFMWMVPYFQQLLNLVIQEVLSHHKDTRYTVQFQAEFNVSSM